MTKQKPLTPELKITDGCYLDLDRLENMSDGMKGNVLKQAVDTCFTTVGLEGATTPAGDKVEKLTHGQRLAFNTLLENGIIRHQDVGLYTEDKRTRPTGKYNKRCANCGTPFYAQRKDARFCRATCRAKNSYKNRKNKS